MKIVRSSYEILTPLDRSDVLQRIERAGRTCYKSEDKITDTSASAFVRGILASGHESVIEHVSMTVKFICDRGVTHELVRHRLVAYSQESTRYCNYSKDAFGAEITVISPAFWTGAVFVPLYNAWELAMLAAEKTYLNMLKMGASPQEARSVLPNSLKTEIVTTANLREWRHILKLRTSARAHPQIREIMVPLLEYLRSVLPELFGEL